MGTSIKLPFPPFLGLAEEESEFFLDRDQEAPCSGLACGELIWQLAGYYRQRRQDDFATSLIRLLESLSDEIDVKSACLLGPGQIAEEERKFDVALSLYLQGLSLEPAEKWVRYFLHNNAGFCLNLKGEYKRAEYHLRSANAIDSTLGNAFKNLAISLGGQGDPVGAARALVGAAQADIPDLAAIRLLEDLLSVHPQLPATCPWLPEKLATCKKTFAEILGA